MNEQRIALVDDSSIFCYIFEKIVEKYDKSKIELMVFDNGKTAFDYFAENKNEALVIPTLMFVDINMPILNGWELLNAFIMSNSPLLDKTIFFIVSSSDNDIDINKSKEYSFVKDYLHKPLDKDQLFSIFDQYLDT